MEKKKKNAIFSEGVVFLVMSIYGIAMSLYSHKSFNVEWKLSPYLFPLFISIFLFILSLSMICKKVDEKVVEVNSCDWKSLIIFSLICIAYLLVFNFLGFVISSILLLSSVMFVLGEKRWWFIALVSILTSILIYFLFAKYLGVMLPKGRVFWYLGL